MEVREASAAKVGLEPALDKLLSKSFVAVAPTTCRLGVTVTGAGALCTPSATLVGGADRPSAHRLPAGAATMSDSPSAFSSAQNDSAAEQGLQGLLADVVLQAPPPCQQKPDVGRNVDDLRATVVRLEQSRDAVARDLGQHKALVSKVSYGSPG
jgi:hypothetical protein